MSIIEKGGLQFIKPDWPAPKNVHAYVTTRIGGYSRSPYDGLNLAHHVGDELNIVEKNRQALTKALQLPNVPVWMDQVHGTEVIDLSSENSSQRPVADGAVTSHQGLVCAVLTADCLPLLMTNKSGTKVGVLHVGWRGLADGIIEQGLKVFAEHPSEVIAWAGPCIGPEDFEVGEDVYDRFSECPSCFTALGNQKYLANLYQLTENRLVKHGVENFTHGHYSTYRETKLLFSHRRNNKCGRLASLIWWGN